MPRLVVMWELPLGLRNVEADAWAHEAALEAVCASGVQRAQLLPLRTAPGWALGYRWMLDAEISDERVVDHPPVSELLHDLASLRTGPLVGLSDRALPVCVD
jgi:hypothetical protein